MRPSNKSRSRNKNQNQNRRSTANVINRVFDSSGPEGKVRGTPQQIIDKYQMLARDAQLSGDRVSAENFLQHSEHYARLLSEATREQNQRREQQEAQQAQQAQNAQRREHQQADNTPPSPASEPAAPAPAPAEPIADLQGSDQPDVGNPPLEVQAAEQPSGLVETPEDKPKPKRRPRAPKPKAPEQAAE